MRQSTAPERTSLQNQSTFAGLSEREAIAGAQKGDAAAFEHLYRLHGRRIHNLCLRMVGDETTADDLTQEAFMQMFRKIGMFRGDSALSTWLHRIAVNVVLMHLRKRSLPSISLDTTEQTGEDGSYATEIGPLDTSWKGAADRLNLTWAIQKLSTGYKRIFLLHDVMGYEHNEIAALLSCSIGNSKSQLHKARQRLRSALQGDLPQGTCQSPIGTT